MTMTDAPNDRRAPAHHAALHELREVEPRRTPPARRTGPKCGNCGTPLALDHPVLLDDATFDRVIGGRTCPCSWTSTPTGVAPAR